MGVFSNCDHLYDARGVPGSLAMPHHHNLGELAILALDCGTGRHP